MERLIDERMGVKRVFCKDKKGFCDYGFEYCRKCQFAKGNGVIDGNIAHDVLATLFGLEYDLDRLRKLVEADRDGRCVILPCKLGTHLYRIGASICKWREIDRCDEYCDGWQYRDCWEGSATIVEESFNLQNLENIGKTVFLTREEAEAALNEMKEAESE